MDQPLLHLLLLDLDALRRHQTKFQVFLSSEQGVANRPQMTMSQLPEFRLNQTRLLDLSPSPQ